MDIWSKGTLKSLFAAGGIILLAAAVLLQGRLLSISASAIDFCYYAVFTAGLLLAWRFRSSRIVLVLLTLVLAHRAIGFFSNGQAATAGTGRIALQAIALLLPVNFIIFSVSRERGRSVAALASPLGLLFLESVFVAVICRPGVTTSPWFLRAAFLSQHWLRWTAIPQLAWLVFGVAFAVLLVRLLLFRKPTEGGMLWSLNAAFAGLQFGGAGRVGSGYFAAAGLILVASVIENSYLLAYHDELTALPGRRSFNETLLGLEAQYVIAVVDIDHFKHFNDTYGHETGDQVLRMVAARLARVTGGGQAFRVGGEEFSIVFSGKSMKQVVPHLESLRTAIEESQFLLRGAPERRSVPRGSDRRSRRESRRKSADPRQGELQFAQHEVSVTVSIGVAENTVRTRAVEQVVQAADKALYRAKRGGRNRVETASGSRSRTSRLKSNIA
ncbi:MAG: GGDEF domain-containing protein [Terriglobales bacterium]